MVRINRYINAHTVRVKKGGDNVGIMPTYKALELANSEGLDLVEVAPTANPPVCEIMDYNKFKYEESKKKKDLVQKNKNITSKEIRLRPVSGDHDVQTKINQLKKFLLDKHPVFINICYKHREMQNRDRGFEIMRNIISSVENLGTPVYNPKFEGTKLSVKITPTTNQ